MQQETGNRLTFLSISVPSYLNMAFVTKMSKLHSVVSSLSQLHVKLMLLLKNSGDIRFMGTTVRHGQTVKGKDFHKRYFFNVKAV